MGFQASLKSYVNISISLPSFAEGKGQYRDVSNVSGLSCGVGDRAGNSSRVACFCQHGATGKISHFLSLPLCAVQHQ